MHSRLFISPDVKPALVMSATSPLSAKTPVQRRPGRMEPADIGEGQRPPLSEAPAYGRDDLTAVHNTAEGDFQGLLIVKEEIKAEIMEEMKEGIEEEVKEEIQEEIDEDIESEGKEEVYSLEAELPFLPWTPDEDPLSVSALQSLVKEENLRCQLPSPSEDFFGFTEVDRDKTSKPTPKGSELLVYYGDDSARELTVHSETSGEAVTSSSAGPSSSGIGGALRCPHCDYRCSELPCLDRHLKTRHGDVVRIGRFHCEWCLYSSDSSARIKRHRKSHTSERPYGCTTCSTRFNSRASLIRHMRIHTGEKPHGCYICKARFFRRSNLNTHMRTHTAERPFSCPFCPARFVFQSSVNRHLRTHTEHLPYGCSVCSARFGHQADLNKHKRTHIEERPYGCSVCAARFYIRSDLIGHMRTHTGERISLTKHTSLPTN